MNQGMTPHEMATTFNVPAGNVVADQPLSMGGLCEGLSADDYDVPEQLVFQQGENIQGTILEVVENAMTPWVRLNISIKTGDHVGKIHEYSIKKWTPSDANANNKKRWIGFLLSFWTREQCLAGKAQASQLVSKTIQFTAGQANEHKGRMYQDLNNMALVQEQLTNNAGF